MFGMKKKSSQFRVYGYTVHPRKVEEFRRAIEQGAAMLGLNCYIFEFETPSCSIFSIAVDNKAPQVAVKIFFGALEEVRKT